MKTLLWVIGIFALAVGLVLAARYNEGFALIVMPPYRVEISLNLLILLLLAGVVVLYSVLRLVYRALRLPSHVRESRLARRRALARSALLDALEAWFAGRYGQAEQAAVQSLEAGEHPHLAAVVAARAAHALGAHERRDAHLARVTEGARDDGALRAVTAAELMLDDRRPAEAIALLDAVTDKPSAALRLELEARRRTGDWARVAALAGELERMRMVDAGAAHELRARAAAEILKEKRADPRALTEAWRQVPDAEKRHPAVAAAAARGYIDAGAHEEARQLIEAALEERWSAELIALYARCAGSDTLREIERARQWLARHPEDPALLLVLGELCARQGLWEDADRYLEASIGARPSCAAHLALARVKDERGAAEAARRHFDSALELALAEIADATAATHAVEPTQKRRALANEAPVARVEETEAAAPIRVHPA